VLGEFTLARLLAKDNLQTALFVINLSDSQVAAAMSFLALAVTTVLLVVMDLLVNRVPSTPKTPAKVISQ
jgi:putative spermidine/putrescine transport system permease protein